MRAVNNNRGRGRGRGNDAAAAGAGAAAGNGAGNNGTMNAKQLYDAVEGFVKNLKNAEEGKTGLEQEKLLVEAMTDLANNKKLTDEQRRNKKDFIAHYKLSRLVANAVIGMNLPATFNGLETHLQLLKGQHVDLSVAPPADASQKKKIAYQAYQKYVVNKETALAAWFAVHFDRLKKEHDDRLAKEAEINENIAKTQTAFNALTNPKKIIEDAQNELNVLAREIASYQNLGIDKTPINAANAEHQKATDELKIATDLAARAGKASSEAKKAYDDAVNDKVRVEAGQAELLLTESKNKCAEAKAHVDGVHASVAKVKQSIEAARKHLAAAELLKNQIEDARKAAKEKAAEELRAAADALRAAKALHDNIPGMDAEIKKLKADAEAAGIDLKGLNDDFEAFRRSKEGLETEYNNTKARKGEAEQEAAKIDTAKTIDAIKAASEQTRAKAQATEASMRKLTDLSTASHEAKEKLLAAIKKLIDQKSAEMATESARDSLQKAQAALDRANRAKVDADRIKSDADKVGLDVADALRAVEAGKAGTQDKFDHTTGLANMAIRLAASEDEAHIHAATEKAERAAVAAEEAERQADATEVALQALRKVHDAAEKQKVDQDAAAAAALAAGLLQARTDAQLHVDNAELDLANANREVVRAQTAADAAELDNDAVNKLGLDAADANKKTANDQNDEAAAALARAKTARDRTNDKVENAKQALEAAKAAKDLADATRAVAAAKQAADDAKPHFNAAHTAANDAVGAARNVAVALAAANALAAALTKARADAKIHADRALAQIALAQAEVTRAQNAAADVARDKALIDALGFPVGNAFLITATNENQNAAAALAAATAESQKVQGENANAQAEYQKTVAAKTLQDAPNAVHDAKIAADACVVAKNLAVQAANDAVAAAVRVAAALAAANAFVAATLAKAIADAKQHADRALAQIALAQAEVNRAQNAANAAAADIAFINGLNLGANNPHVVAAAAENQNAIAALAKAQAEHQKTQQENLKAQAEHQKTVAAKTLQDDPNAVQDANAAANNGVIAKGEATNAANDAGVAAARVAAARQLAIAAAQQANQQPLPPPPPPPAAAAQPITDPRILLRIASGRIRR